MVGGRSPSRGDGSPINICTRGGQHIFWNLVSIYFLVPMLERVWGWQRTLAMYTAGGIVLGD